MTVCGRRRYSRSGTRCSGRDGKPTVQQESGWKPPEARSRPASCTAAGVQSYLSFFFSSRRRHTRLQGDWSSDVCSSDLLSAPVAKLAIDSQENLARRKRVEAALASTHEELERSTRFSADASHQLKTPVTDRKSVV